jgi:hypothetical protein
MYARAHHDLWVRRVLLCNRQVLVVESLGIGQTQKIAIVQDDEGACDLLSVDLHGGRRDVLCSVGREDSVSARKVVRSSFARHLAVDESVASVSPVDECMGRGSFSSVPDACKLRSHVTCARRCVNAEHTIRERRQNKKIGRVAYSLPNREHKPAWRLFRPGRRSRNPGFYQ